MRRLAIIVLLALFAESLFAQGFTIQRFSSDLALRSDGRLDVTETIRTIFSESHHGIFRTIPVTYNDGKGAARSIRLSNISVTDETGKSLETKISREGADVKIRIGDPDEYVSVGVPTTYVVRYSSFGQLNWFDRDDTWDPFVELYWNLTGDQWQAPMEQVDFTLHFPAADAKKVRARLYVGPYGSRNFVELVGGKASSGGDPSSGSLTLKGNELKGSSSRSLMPYEGVTLVLDLPYNSIAKPTALQAVGLFLSGNPGLLLPFLTLAVMFVIWLMRGKDPARKPIAVQFEPPDGLSGSECGTLIDERVDPRDIAAGVIGLAVKGQVVLHPKTSGMVFKHQTADIEVVSKVDGVGLSRFEQKLLSKLRSAGGLVDDDKLRTYIAPHLSEFKSCLYDSLVEHGYYLKDPNSIRTGTTVIGLFAVVGLAYLMAIINPVGAIWPAIVGGIISGIIVISFGKIMPRRTYKGAEAFRGVKGFEEFIRRARGKEIDWMSKKEPSMALFEEYLPHAIAFGLAAEWAAAFDGILHEMPNWYAAPTGTHFYPLYFGNDLTTIGQSISTAAATPPRS